MGFRLFDIDSVLQQLSKKLLSSNRQRKSDKKKFLGLINEFLRTNYNFLDVPATRNVEVNILFNQQEYGVTVENASGKDIYNISLLDLRLMKAARFGTKKDIDIKSFLYDLLGKQLLSIRQHYVAYKTPLDKYNQTGNLEDFKTLLLSDSELQQNLFINQLLFEFVQYKVSPISLALSGLSNALKEKAVYSSFAPSPLFKKLQELVKRVIDEEEEDMSNRLLFLFSLTMERLSDYATIEKKLFVSR